MTVDAETMEMLADYECPECGPLVDEDGALAYLFPSQADDVLGGGENGFIRCPDCGEELEMTLDARLDMMKMIVERHPEMANAIAQRLEHAAADLTDLSGRCPTCGDPPDVDPCYCSNPYHFGRGQS